MNEGSWATKHVKWERLGENLVSLTIRPRWTGPLAVLSISMILLPLLAAAGYLALTIILEMSTNPLMQSPGMPPWVTVLAFAEAAFFWTILLGKRRHVLTKEVLKLQITALPIRTEIPLTVIKSINSSPLPGLWIVSLVGGKKSALMGGLLEEEAHQLAEELRRWSGVPAAPALVPQAPLEQLPVDIKHEVKAGFVAFHGRHGNNKRLARAWLNLAIVPAVSAVYFLRLFISGRGFLLREYMPGRAGDLIMFLLLGAVAALAIQRSYMHILNEYFPEARLRETSRRVSIQYAPAEFTLAFHIYLDGIGYSMAVSQVLGLIEHFSHIPLAPANFSETPFVLIPVMIGLFYCFYGLMQLRRGRLVLTERGLLPGFPMRRIPLERIRKFEVGRAVVLGTNLVVRTTGKDLTIGSMNIHEAVAQQIVDLLNDRLEEYQRADPDLSVSPALEPTQLASHLEQAGGE